MVELAEQIQNLVRSQVNNVLAQNTSTLVVKGIGLEVGVAQVVLSLLVDLSDILQDCKDVGWGDLVVWCFFN